MNTPGGTEVLSLFFRWLYLQLCLGLICAPFREDITVVSRDELSETSFDDFCVALFAPSGIAQEYLRHAQVPACGGSDTPVTCRTVRTDGLDEFPGDLGEDLAPQQ